MDVSLTALGKGLNNDITIMVLCSVREPYNPLITIIDTGHLLREAGGETMSPLSQVLYRPVHGSGAPHAKGSLILSLILANADNELMRNISLQLYYGTKDETLAARVYLK